MGLQLKMFFVPKLWLRGDLSLRARRYTRCVQVGLCAGARIAALPAAVLLPGHAAHLPPRTNTPTPQRGLLYTFNLHTLALLALSCLSVAFCHRTGFAFNIDFSLVALGSTFPLVFAIQSAFNRRERALSQLAQFKASAVCLYYMHRDWAQVCLQRCGCTAVDD